MIDPFNDAHRVVVFPLTELLLLQMDAARGCKDAAYAVDAAVAFMQQVASAPPDQPAGCACCGQPIQRHDRFCVGAALPAVGDPTLGHTFLVCNNCGCMPSWIDAAVARMVI